MTVKVGFKNLPAPIKKHLEKSIGKRFNRPHVYHVTELIYCLRKAYYNRTHPGQTKFNMRSLWNIYRGNIFDKRFTRLFEIHQKTYRVKKRGVTITGTLDFVHDDSVYDLKMPVTVAMKKFSGANLGYRRQVAAYLALAHANGELTDITRARVLMIAENVVVDEVKEWVEMLNAWLWPRAFTLDAALQDQDPSMLQGPEEGWECNPEYCNADDDFRIAYALQKARQKLPPVEPHTETPEPDYVKKMKEVIY